MGFLEFLEALARVADKYDMANLHDHFPEYSSRNPFGLDKKVESVVFMLIKYCLGEKIFTQVHSRYSMAVARELEAAA